MKTIRLVLFVLLIYSCNPKVDQIASKLVDKKADTLTVNLYKNLMELKNRKKILFGHQDDLAYGVGWKYEDGKSDVKLTGGAYPALYGWELGRIEFGDAVNIDSVPFDKMRMYMIQAFERGGVITCSWHAYNPTNGKSSWDDTKEKNNTVTEILPNGKHHTDFINNLDKVADFLLSVKTIKGVAVPIIFRPFHENNGDWFWWGQKHCTPEEYIALYRFTVDYLKNKRGIHNLLYAYSPDIKFENPTDYMNRYPGDEYVDILGIDDYYDFKSENPVEKVGNRLKVVAEHAEKHQKIYALTETGSNLVPDSLWFTSKLLAAIKSNPQAQGIAYVMIWRNAGEKEFYIPAPNHKSAADFKKFLNDCIILTNDNLPDMYK